MLRFPSVAFSQQFVFCDGDTVDAVHEDKNNHRIRCQGGCGGLGWGRATQNSSCLQLGTAEHNGTAVYIFLVSANSSVAHDEKRKEYNSTDYRFSKHRRVHSHIR